MLELKNICYETTGKKILDNVSFTCKNNETIAITGHNGSGKTTLLKIIMGIIKPTSGKIFFEGKDITNLEIHERAKIGIAYSFQKPVVFNGITVEQLLSIASKTKTAPDYCEILSELGLCAREYQRREVNDKLSGGEQKRIDIATVLSRKAKLNLFDEPEAGIDIWSFDNLVKLFKNLKSSNIIVSHQKKLIEKSDKILILNDGKIVKFDKTKKILPQLKECKYCVKIRK